ncbi:acetoacetate decarboxylase family protein [Rufibacter psychrotolerans]|uniref:acetoacetate decarboxylase family protein n=1 Tax=Rufibacter psychrotolerans TaxID=2812556 RepID=UPI001967DE54|nr:acetoacetate decarboxylase family protein [Rufibacter sp. SYSU D00308]
MESSSFAAPPPWTLTGEGIVWLYAIPKGFNRHHGFLADYQTEGYVGKIGAVLYFNYTTSDVGPYQELIYLPGLFRVGGKLAFSISKIYVSTLASASNGWQNWGIPKEEADFSLRKSDTGDFQLQVSRHGLPFFAAQAKPFGPALPVTTRLFPWTRLVQQHPRGLLLTNPQLHGQAQLATTQTITADARLFPPVQHLKPLCTVVLRDVKMDFPVPELMGSAF